jgi:prefoldin subunit 5
MPIAPQMTRDQELDFLKAQAQAMRQQLEQIEARVQQLGSEP